MTTDGGKMITPEKVLAPTLPKGMRFKVSKDKEGDLLVSLQKKFFGIWGTLHSNYIIRPLRRENLAERIEALMKHMLDTHKRQDISTSYLNSVCGLYPPKKIIG